MVSGIVTPRVYNDTLDFDLVRPFQLGCVLLLANGICLGNFILCWSVLSTDKLPFPLVLDRAADKKDTTRSFLRITYYIEAN